MTEKMSSTPAELLIKQEIDRLGPMRFDRFVDIALYHPLYGYYNQARPQRGRRGDYFTSLQVSKLFPRIFAEAVMHMWDALGCEQFSLIEIGSGDGEFLEGVLTALAEKKKTSGLKVWAVEKSRPARERLWRALSRFPKCKVVPSLEDIEWFGGLEGCVVSNECLDALPFRRLRFAKGAWQEIGIQQENGKLGEALMPLSEENVLKALGNFKPDTEGQEIEIRPAVEGLLEEIGQWLVRGYIVTFDYGHPRAQLYSPFRKNGTWMCYRNHTANQDIFNHIGQQDITAHVDFTHLMEKGLKMGFTPALYASQGIFLSHVGQDPIEGFLKEGNAGEQRRHAAQVRQLIHPDAMGEVFWVLVQARNTGLPDRWNSIPNRLRRLV